MQTSQEINELATALAKAQGEFKPIERTRTVRVQMKSGGSYTFDYAPLDTILAATMPALAKHGLSVSWSPEATYHDGFVEVRQTCRLAHSSGQWQEATIPLRSHELAPQGMGSVLTYGRRYSFEHVVGVVSETDDDGAGAAGNEAEHSDRPAKPDCPKCGNSTHVIKGKQEYGGGWICWKNKGGCGHKWQDEPKSTVEALKEEGKLTTADQLPPISRFPMATATVSAYTKVSELVTFAEWIKAQRVDQGYTDQEYHDLNNIIAAKAVEFPTNAKGFEAAAKLLKSLHDEGRLSEGDYIELGIKLEDAKDKRLPQPA